MQQEHEALQQLMQLWHDVLQRRLKQPKRPNVAPSQLHGVLQKLTLLWHDALQQLTQHWHDALQRR